MAGFTEKASSVRGSLPQGSLEHATLPVESEQLNLPENLQSTEQKAAIKIRDLVEVSTMGVLAAAEHRASFEKRESELFHEIAELNGLTDSPEIDLQILKANIDLNKAKTRDIVIDQEILPALAQARYARGYFLTLGQRGSNEQFSEKLAEANKSIAELESKLEGIGASSERIDTIYAEVAKSELRGLSEFDVFKERQAKEALADYARKKDEGGAWFAFKETMTTAGESAVAVLETSSTLVVGNVAQVGGLVVGTALGENPLTYARDTGASYIGGSRQFFNNHTTGSVFGDDSEFSKLSLPSAALKMNPLAHVGGVVVAPAFETLDTLRVQAARSFYQAGGMAVSYSQYRELEKTDPVLRVAKNAFKIGETAGALALGRPESVGALAQTLGVASGMGAAGALSQELMSEEGFQVGRFVDNTIAGTADSALFMGGLSALTRGYAAMRLGHLQGVRTLSEAELKLVSDVTKNTKAFSEAVDFMDSQGDLVAAIANFDNITLQDPQFIRKIAGAVLGLAVAGQDAFDVKLGSGTFIQSGVDSLVAKVRRPETQDVLLPDLDPIHQASAQVDRSAEISSNGKLVYLESAELLQEVYAQKTYESLIKQGASDVEAIEKAGEQSQGVQGFFERAENLAYVVKPDTLQEGASPDRATRLMQASVVIHELEHQRLEELAPVKNEAEALTQEIAATKKQTEFLEQRGFELLTSDTGIIGIKQTRSDAEQSRLDQLQSNRNLEANATGNLETSVLSFVAAKKLLTKERQNNELKNDVLTVYSKRNNIALAASLKGSITNEPKYKPLQYREVTTYSDTNSTTPVPQINTQTEIDRKYALRTWVAGVDPHQHSDNLLNFIAKEMGDPPVQIILGHTPYNSEAFKLWRHRVSPNIPDTAFMLRFMTDTQKKQFIIAETKSLESRSQEKTSIASIDLNNNKSIFRGFEELSDLLSGKKVDSDIDLNIKYRFIAPTIYGLSDELNGQHVLIFSSDNYSYHNKAIKALTEILEPYDDSEPNFDYKLSAIGYLQVIEQVNINGQNFVSHILLQDSSLVDSPVKANFDNQVELIVDYLIEHGVIFTEDAKLSIKYANESKPLKEVSVTEMQSRNNK